MKGVLQVQIAELEQQLREKKDENTMLQNVIDENDPLGRIRELEQRITELENQNALLKVRLQDAERKITRAQDSVLEQVAGQKRPRFKEIPVRTRSV